jgi:hypothetical protein
MAATSASKALVLRGAVGLTEGMSSGLNPSTPMDASCLIKGGNTTEATVFMPETRTVPDNMMVSQECKLICPNWILLEVSSGKTTSHSLSGHDCKNVDFKKVEMS